VDRRRRLKKGKEIQAVFDSGASLRGSRFFLRSVPNDVGVNRWAFAVGKKLAPGSVERNRVRRKLREAVCSAGVEDKDGRDIVLIAGRGSMEASVGELARELERMLEQLKGQVRR
jgi:ribonuclease P protein component